MSVPLGARYVLVPLLLAAAMLALVWSASTPAAHAQQNGLVNVDISNVDVDIANDLNIEVEDLIDVVGTTVQAPIGVAANVCDVNANVLAAQRRNGGAECTANNTSEALNQFALREFETG